MRHIKKYIFIALTIIVLIFIAVSYQKIKNNITTVQTTSENTRPSTNATFISTHALKKIPPISPSSGSTSGGDSIVITGTDLSHVTNVAFGGINASITADSASSITVISPPNSAGAVDVAVTKADGSTIIFGTYNYFALQQTTSPISQNRLLPPTISALSPKSGSIDGGDFVTITGAHLFEADSVTFDGVNARITANTETSVTVTTPQHNVANTVDVAVTTEGGTATDSDAYTYFIPPPTIKHISSTSGSTAGGDSLIIFGANLSRATSVTLGGVNAAVTANTRHKIIVTTPPHAVGSVDVVVTTKGGSATSAASFAYVVPMPVITRISPRWGYTTGMEPITIKGNNFSGATSVNFGGLNASHFVVNSDGTSIKVVTPPRAAGTVDVTVTTPGATSAATKVDQYTYIAVPPVVTTISPTSGLTTGGVPVSIYGTDLSTTTNVYFGGANVSFYIISPTEITATAPAGNPGVVNVEVVTSGGTAVSPQPYTLYPPAVTLTR